MLSAAHLRVPSTPPLVPCLTRFVVCLHLLLSSSPLSFSPPLFLWFTNENAVYPACNLDQCTGANGCVCPSTILEPQSSSEVDVCNCTDNFIGPFCTEFSTQTSPLLPHLFLFTIHVDCSDDSICSFNGMCDNIQGCVCSPTFYGPYCETCMFSSSLSSPPPVIFHFINDYSK